MKGENHFIMKVNRKYKDRLFRIVFREKEDLLDLYNAVNSSDYDNPEELEIMTIEDVIYVHMKNDVAFLLSDLLNLWEHQSTYNPNMPARGLGYFAQLYQQYIELISTAANRKSFHFRNISFSTTAKKICRNGWSFGCRTLSLPKAAKNSIGSLQWKSLRI